MKIATKVFCLLFLLACLAPVHASAGWIENGVPLTQQCWGTVGAGVIVSDGSSGAIIAYQTCHNGVGHLLVQHVDSMGVALWAHEGVDVCTDTSYQQHLQITSDGAGGAIITWEDYRAGNWDTYVQRVNVSGTVLWTATGVPLCMAAGDQQYPTITSDGAGGAIVSWQDYRYGSNYDIYAQRVNASGVAQWKSNGVAVCNETGDQSNPQIASDGAAGAIISWQDYRSGSNYDIYAQRVNASGAAQWTSNGVHMCVAMADQSHPTIISDGASGAIVAWYDYRSGSSDIYAQRVNASGVAQWTPADGVRLGTALGPLQNPAIISDGAGGVIVTWNDNSLAIFPYIHATRVDSSGTTQWTERVHPGSLADLSVAAIASDGAGGAIVTWPSYGRGSDNKIYAQRMNASGTAQWTAEGVRLSMAAGGQWKPASTSDGAGGAIITWDDWRNGNRDIYAQRVNASGAAQWTAGGVAICTATGNQSSPQITSDGAGGAIITWEDLRSGDYNIYAQRVNASGVAQWTPADGVRMSMAAGWQGYPAIISDGAGGAIVTWESASRHIYAQRIDASGEVQWTSYGIPLCEATGMQEYPNVVSDGAGGAIVAWRDNRSGNTIYAQRVNASGEVQWTTDGNLLCTATGSWSKPAIVSDGASGAIVAWWDNRNGNFDIYAQKVNASGTVEWTANGRPICAATGDQQYPTITSNGSGGAIISWQDYRNGSSYDIYAQRVNALGVVQWTTNGVPLCEATGDQQLPTITADDAGGAIITWYDGRSGTADIYAQWVNASGTVLWTADGRALCTATGNQQNPAITSDGAGGAIVVWEDGRCGPMIYALRVFGEYSGHVTAVRLAVALYPNHPNPFNPRTVIRFYLPEAQEIVLDVYNVAGERVARLAEGRKEKGNHEVAWDGRNTSGTVCSSGVYFSRLTVGKSSISRKMVIMR